MEQTTSPMTKMMKDADAENGAADDSSFLTDDGYRCSSYCHNGCYCCCAYCASAITYRRGDTSMMLFTIGQKG